MAAINWQGMTSSACFITRNNCLRLFLATLLIASVLPRGARSQVSQAMPSPVASEDLDLSSASGLQDLVNALEVNSLEGAGKLPFHLKLTFQLYDLNGKPSEQGTLELWWAEGWQPLLTVTTPSLGTLSSLLPEQLSSAEGRRSVYLINQLLQSITKPAVLDAKAKLVVTQKRQTEGKTVLDCMHLDPQPGLPLRPSLEKFCFAESNKALRTASGLQLSEVRNKLGLFGKTFVGMSSLLALEQKEAISAQIDVLQSFQPNHAPVTLVPAKPEAADASSASQKPDVQSTKILHSVPPVYPLTAREAYVAGTVILGATLTEAGNVTNLFPIASPDKRLTEAAMDAVKHWTYQPALLNGKPVQLNTTVTVNFNLSTQRN